MFLKNLKRRDPPSFGYDFNGWDEECLKQHRELVEDSMKEAYIRETAIYSRVGSLLALNGVILAVVCTLISRATSPYGSVSAYLLASGICALMISVLILGYLLTPAPRMVTRSESCRSDKNYENNRSRPTEIRKAILRDRINSHLDLQDLLNITGKQFMIAILFSVTGLGMIGSALITSIINETAAIFVCISIGAIIIWFASKQKKKLSIPEKDGNERTDEIL